MRFYFALFTSFFSIVLYAQNTGYQSTIKDTSAWFYAKTITPHDLKKHLYIIASDSMQGRMTASIGQKKAAKYIAKEMKRIGLLPAVVTGKDSSYFQKFKVVKSGWGMALYRNREPDNRQPSEAFETENVVGWIEGTDKKDEFVIISAHYDHVGIENNKIHYGADDNGSGTSSILEMAEAFMKAKKAGKGPRRSIVFMLVSGEEVGLLGSQYYADFDPIFPVNKTVVDLNTDMIGRIDDKYLATKTTDYVYLIGSDKLSMDLYKLQEDVNKNSLQLKLDYTYNDISHPEMLYYRSDHYNFAKKGIPVIFYFSGLHEDYHKPTDTPEKIHYPKMTKIAQLIFLTAWEIANRDERIKLDKK